ncbi:MAG: 4'-phosphopantetheinyl transferase superfamily protein [Acidobacteriota bacterium]
MSWEPAPNVLPALADSLHLWFFSLETSAEERARLLPLLSSDERARAERFVVERPRRQMIVGRGRLRETLGRYLDRDPASLRFDYGDDGKPFLVRDDGEDRPLEFNLSHSGTVALLGVVDHGRLGVDVETVRYDTDHLAIAVRFFSEIERERLARFSTEEIPHAFFRCWTRKEAYLKAVGTGLRRPLAGFDVDFAEDDHAALLATRFDEDEAARWSLAPVNVGVDHAAAWCLDWTPSTTRRYQLD